MAIKEKQRIKKNTLFDVGLFNSLVLLPTRPRKNGLASTKVSLRIVGEKKTGRLKAYLTAALFFVMAFLFINASSYADSLPEKKYYTINVPQQNAADALNLLAEQTGITFLFPYNIAETQQANSVVGRFALKKALELLLQGSELSGGLTDSGVVIISHKDLSKNGKGMGMNSKKNLLAATVAFFVGGGSSVGALGQEVEAYSGKGLEEIIITASRRETNLNDTAISMAAIGGEEISQRNLTEMNDYLRTIPGINYIDQGVGRNGVIIRGLGIDPELEGFVSSPTVGHYFGETPIAGLSSTGGTADIKMVDLERVEVLRGPQGTLFGSGALAGAIRNIPNAPNLSSIEGSIKVGYSNTSGEGDTNNKVEGVLNIPLIEDVLAVRAVAYRHDTSGFIKNIAGTQLANNGIVGSSFTASEAVATYGGSELYQNKDGIGDVVFEGGRVTFLWQPVEDFKASLMYMTQEVDQDGDPYVQLNTGGYTQVSIQYGDVLPGEEEGMSDDISITNLVLEYDFGWASLLSTSAWLEQDYRRNVENSSFIGGSPFAQLQQVDSEIFTEEIRLVSRLDGSWQFIAGVYYEDRDLLVDQVSYATGDLDLNFFGPSSPLGPTNPLLNDANIKRPVEQLAFFGEISYDLTDELELTLGGRHYDYERSKEESNRGIFGAEEDDTSVEVNEDGTNLKVNLSYQPDDNTLVYLQWAEGFRLGDAAEVIVDSLCDVDDNNILDGTTTTISDSFESDSLETIELGFKLSAIENRLQVNGAIYHTDWKDIPLRIFAGKLPSQTDQTCFSGLTVNAGEARSQGMEIETTYQATEKFQLKIGGSYTNAELTSVISGIPFESGDRLPSSPEYNFNLGMYYDFELAERPSYISADYAYVGEFYNRAGEEGEKGGGYGQVNVNAGIDWDAVSIELYIHNLTDADDIISVGTLYPDTRAYRLRPRTIGFNVGYHF